MADVQALDMDVVTEKSGHSVVGMAVSVCLTPAAPAPLPIPYPLTATVSEGHRRLPAPDQGERNELRDAPSRI
jgi:hypothetical protein